MGSLWFESTNSYHPSPLVQSSNVAAVCACLSLYISLQTPLTVVKCCTVLFLKGCSYFPVKTLTPHIRYEIFLVLDGFEIYIHIPLHQTSRSSSISKHSNQKRSNQAAKNIYLDWTSVSSAIVRHNNWTAKSIFSSSAVSAIAKRTQTAKNIFISTILCSAATGAQRLF